MKYLSRKSVTLRDAAAAGEVTDLEELTQHSTASRLTYGRRWLLQSPGRRQWNETT